MATDLATTHDPTADLLRLGAVHAAAVALPVLVLALVLVPLWLAPLLAVAVGVAVTILRGRNLAPRVAAALGARRVAGREVPRLAGVVESMSMAIGVAPPVLHVIDDPARNAVVWGTGTGPSSLAVTTGLLDVAERIELEAVVAHLLADVRDGVVEAPTVAAALFGSLAGGPLAGVLASLTRTGVDQRRIVLADIEGARATQYPPGAVAALQRVRAGSSGVVRNRRPLQPLWYAAPSEPSPDDPFAVHPPIADRLDLLREL